MSGYIFSFQGRQFSPDGQVNVSDETAHNKAIADSQLASMKRGERQILYVFGSNTIGENTQVGTWDSSHKWKVICSKRSRHNWGLTRTDYWFTACGFNWHGVNIGDNDIVRCKRVK